MAGKEESEQKSLPASDKKLRDARRKGQVSNSRDLISGFGLLAVVAYLLFTWTLTRDHVLQLVELISSSAGRPWRRAKRCFTPSSPPSASWC
jgi:type III secretion protein U